MTMPFGKHKGLPIENVPRDYLLWLNGKGIDNPSLRAEVCRVLENRKPPEQIIEELQRKITELEDTIEYGGELINEDIKFIEEWYLKIVRIAHPDRSGNVAVMQAINDLKQHYDKKYSESLLPTQNLG